MEAGGRRLPGWIEAADWMKAVGAADGDGHGGYATVAGGRSSWRRSWRTAAPAADGVARGGQWLTRRMTDDGGMTAATDGGSRGGQWLPRWVKAAGSGRRRWRWRLTQEMCDSRRRAPVTADGDDHGGCAAGR